MGFRLPAIRRASFTTSKSAQAPKGCIAVYVGETQKRFVIPISYLNQPSFQELLCQVEEDFSMYELCKVKSHQNSAHWNSSLISE
ncbi:hypothetical protein Fmac_021495 [Flemingia macrophylla]|uniref:Small auxin up regulated protein n=1 Tax=Flemingia macrophylla TaxID=520843 RepID=A0ABD1LXL7_9FABA